MLTSEQLWPEIRDLHGRELRTLVYGHPFEVSVPGEDGVVLSPVVSGQAADHCPRYAGGGFRCAFRERRELTGLEIARGVFVLQCALCGRPAGRTARCGRL